MLKKVVVFLLLLSSIVITPPVRVSYANPGFNFYIDVVYSAQTIWNSGDNVVLKARIVNNGDITIPNGKLNTIFWVITPSSSLIIDGYDMNNVDIAPGQTYTFQSSWSSAGGSQGSYGIKVNVKGTVGVDVEKISTQPNAFSLGDGGGGGGGSLRVYVRNVNDQLRSGATVILYDSGMSKVDQKTTGSGGYADWSGLENKGYNVEVYYPSPAGLGLNEFWGGDSVSVSGSTTLNFKRHTQWVFNIQVNGVNPGSWPVSVNTGSSVTISVTVRNDEGGSSSKNVKVRLILDRDQATAYDFDQTSSAQAIGSLSSGTFTFTYTPSASGVYYLYAVVSGSYPSGMLVTDQYNWSSAVSVAAYPTHEVIQFSGYTWDVMHSEIKVEPGPNFWSNSAENVWVDGNGWLHLKVTYRNGKWYCAEVSTQQALGYGTYTFYAASNIDNLDKNVVLGLFGYKDDNHESDIEFSRWGNSANKNAWFTVQPSPYDDSNQKSFNIVLTGTYSTQSFSWNQNGISFISLHGHYKPEAAPQSNIIQSWQCSLSRDAEGAKAHINLWLFQGSPPSNGKEVEVVIEGFEFTSSVSSGRIKILIDEGHSEFLVTGNAYNLVQSLRAKGYIVDPFNGTVTSSLLSNYNVLIIGTAWSSFSTSEIQAIVNFINNGGGLLLTGVGWSWVDYHPSSTIDAYPMNQIATKFGVFFNPDIIFDPNDYTTNNGSAIFHTPFIYNHPATLGVSRIGASDMCIGSISVQTGSILVTGDDDSFGGYSQSPYANGGSHPPMLVALNYGSGKVIAIGHEGFLVDAHIDEFDNKKLALNIIDWLAEPFSNLIKNPGFEQQLTYWSSTGGTATYSADLAQKHSGTYSAKGVESAEGNLGRLYQDVTSICINGRLYKIGGWIKTENVVGNVVIALDYVTSSGWSPADGYVKEIGHVTGTTGWQYFESEEFTLPSMPNDCTALWFLFDFNAGKGRAWFDDIYLIEVSPSLNVPTSDAGPDQTCITGTTLIFDGSNSKDTYGIIVSYSWDFGDGSPKSSQKITTHIYTTPGTYTVILSVTDDGGATDTDQATITVKPALPKWTVMFYLNGDNDLERNAVKAVNELEKIGSSKEINLVALLDRSKKQDTSSGNWAGARFFKIEKDDDANNIYLKTLIESKENANLGSKDTLSDFIKKTVNLYPAEHYMLIINDHGFGFRGVSYDEGSYDYLNMTELKQALIDGGKKFDIIVFDACLMSMIEVAYQIKNYADYMIASETITWADPLFREFPYYKMLNELVNDPLINVKELDIRLVDVYAGEYSRDPYPATLSVIDLKKMDSLKNSINDLSNYLLNNFIDNSNIVQKARNKVIDFPTSYYFKIPLLAESKSGYIDLKQFCTFMKFNASNMTFKSLVDSVLVSIGDVVVVSWDNIVIHVGGVSIYFPLNKAGNTFDNLVGGDYDIDFKADSKWNEFVKAYLDYYWSRLFIMSTVNGKIVPIQISIDNPLLRLHSTPFTIDLAKEKHAFDAVPAWYNSTSGMYSYFKKCTNSKNIIISEFNWFEYTTLNDDDWILTYEKPSSGSTVVLAERQSKLYLHVYDSENHHVGYNNKTGQVDLEISGAKYADLNKTMIIYLPQTLSNFKYVVDASKAVESVESYNVTVSTINQGTLSKTLVSSNTIKKMEQTEVRIKVNNDQSIQVVQQSSGEIPAFPLVSIMFGFVIFFLIRTGAKTKIRKILRSF